MFPLRKTFDFGIKWPDDEELSDSRSKVNIIDISDDDDTYNVSGKKRNDLNNL